MDCEDGTDTNHIRVLPDTCVELFVNYTSTPLAIIGNELYDRSIVTSRLSRYSDVQMRKGAGCIAICFYPGAACRFFNLPMHLLADRTISLSDLWNSMAGKIESKLADAFSHNERSAIIQKYLLQQLMRNERDQQIAQCLEKIRRSAGNIQVSSSVLIPALASAIFHESFSRLSACRQKNTCVSAGLSGHLIT
ncbi:MAG TPA: hypothetical protein PLN99_11135 [Daejeonella sp.]|nr:hypothetical protein [Daejeonella sp.]HQS52442.1 hypothetical protein [Daejeonella sp.]